MSIARVVDHLYEINKDGDKVTVFFLTSRSIYFIPIFVVFGACFTVGWTAVHLGWNGNVIAGIIGGSISFVLSTCFVMAEQITQHVITIENDVVFLQRRFEGIPVGRKKIYSRTLLTDLGVYPDESRTRAPVKSGQLCVWAGGKSIALENHFPISEGASLAADLREQGIEFRRTHEEFSYARLGTGRMDEFLSF